MGKNAVEVTCSFRMSVTCGKGGKGEYSSFDECTCMMPDVTGREDTDSECVLYDSLGG